MSHLTKKWSMNVLCESPVCILPQVLSARGLESDNVGDSVVGVGTESQGNRGPAFVFEVLIFSCPSSFHATTLHVLMPVDWLSA